MSITSDRLPRRSFLTGAASLIGVATVGIAPQFAEGAIGGHHAIKSSESHAFSMYFWDGAQFVAATSAKGTTPKADTVRVELSELGARESGRSVDVRLPGGPFHAFTSGPHGAGRAAFNAPATSLSGLGFTVTANGTSTSFDLVNSVLGGIPILVGEYLIVGSGVDISTVHLGQGSESPLLHHDGSPTQAWSVLIRITEA